jgi:hypothetical protein
LRTQLTEARKNIKASKKELAGNKKELAEEKRRFRNWRARHREDPLAVALNDAKRKHGTGKSKELDNLLKTYLEEKCSHRSESQDHVQTTERASSSGCRRDEASYFDVCAKFTWDPFVNNDEKFEKLVSVNELTRRKMSSKDQKNIKNKGFCDAATYKYEHTAKWAESTNASRELDNFTVRHDVSAMGSQERGERLKRCFSSLSSDMLGKIDSKFLDLQKAKKVSQKGKKVLRQYVL